MATANPSSHETPNTTASMQPTIASDPTALPTEPVAASLVSARPAKHSPAAPQAAADLLLLSEEQINARANALTELLQEMLKRESGTGNFRHWGIND